MNDKQAMQLFKEQDYLQYNLTNKLVRTFLRLGCHYNNIDVLSFPYEVDSCLHIGINDNKVMCNNYLLYEIYKLIEEHLNNISYRK